MSGTLDSKSLLALCLLVVRRRRRRLRQNEVQDSTHGIKSDWKRRVRRPLVDSPVLTFSKMLPSTSREDRYRRRQNEDQDSNDTPASTHNKMIPRTSSEDLHCLRQCEAQDGNEASTGPHNEMTPSTSKGDRHRCRQNEDQANNKSHGDKCSRKWWVRPSLADVSARTHSKMFHSSLREDPEKFLQHYQMSIESFDDILASIEKSITGRDTFMREAVDPETKLAATLRFLTMGFPYRVISEEFCLGRSTISIIVRHVCKAIWVSLRSPYIGEPSVDDLLKISEDYERKTGFPHCLGAVGGRYIHVKQKSSINNLFIFPNHFAAAFIALVDSNFYFRYVDVSGYRQENDLFKATGLGAKVLSNSLSLPQPELVPNFSDPLPYVFVTKDLPPSENVLKPFSQKRLSPEKILFNCSIDKAMVPLDSALALLTGRWRILQRPFDQSGESMLSIVRACCVLHNYLGKQEGFPTLEELKPCTFDHLEPVPKSSGSGGSSVRSLFVDYFNSTCSKKDVQE